MDRFKFRVWNKRYSKYHYDAEMTFEENKVLGIDYFGQYLDDDDFVVEQCTGLKDKNGKLIYEGDYIKSGNVIHIICWDNKNAKFVAQNKGYSCEIYQSWIDECKFEVIGNIHQNNELLKDNK